MPEMDSWPEFILNSTQDQEKSEKQGFEQ
jgi:hypothetical protein